MRTIVLAALAAEDDHDIVEGDRPSSNTKNGTDGSTFKKKTRRNYLLGCIYQSGYTALDSKKPTPSCQTFLSSQMKNFVCKKGGDDVDSDQGCPEVCKPNGKFTVLVEIAQVHYNLYA